jgi:hypothetical protein
MNICTGVGKRRKRVGKNSSPILNLFSPKHNLFDGYCHIDSLRESCRDFIARRHELQTRKHAWRKQVDVCTPQFDCAASAERPEPINHQFLI